jgi:O-antigen ligase
MPAVPGKESLVQSGYCNEQFQCQKEYDTAQRVYERNGFLVSVIGGTLLLILSLFLPVTALAVGQGLSLGAILSFVVGSMGYWSFMDEWLRLTVLVAAFVALIAFAIKKLGRE